MSNELINVNAGGELIAQDVDLLKETSKSAAFLPYFQLFTLKSSAVAEDKIQGGHYGLVRDGNITGLGKEVSIVVATVRARAYEKADDGEVFVCFDKNDPEYIRIKELQANKVLNRMVGPEFLIWIPVEKTFASFFCGSATLKRESGKLGPFLSGETLQKRAATMRSKLITKGEWKWHGPVITACSSPISVLPTQEEWDKELHKFKNPPKTVKGEKVAAGDGTDAVTR
jgi:hypothetical protein